MTQILLVSLFENVWRTVWRIYILMLGGKGLIDHRRPNNIKRTSMVHWALCHLFVLITF